MKRYAERRIGILLVGMVVVGLPAARAQEPIEDLRVPMEYYEDGTLKSELFASRAAVRADGVIAAWGIVFRRFTALSVLDSVIRAEDALFNQEQQIATSRRAMSMQSGDLHIAGEGFTWNGTEGVLRIHQKARVTFPSAMINVEGVLNRAQ